MAMGPGLQLHLGGPRQAQREGDARGTLGQGRARRWCEALAPERTPPTEWVRQAARGTQANRQNGESWGPTYMLEGERSVLCHFVSKAKGGNFFFHVIKLRGNGTAGRKVKSSETRGRGRGRGHASPRRARSTRAGLCVSRSLLCPPQLVEVGHGEREKNGVFPFNTHVLVTRAGPSFLSGQVWAEIKHETQGQGPQTNQGNEQDTTRDGVGRRRRS